MTSNKLLVIVALVNCLLGCTNQSVPKQQFTEKAHDRQQDVENAVSKHILQHSDLAETDFEMKSARHSEFWVVDVTYLTGRPDSQVRFAVTEDGVVEDVTFRRVSDALERHLANDSK